MVLCYHGGNDVHQTKSPKVSKQGDNQGGKAMRTWYFVVTLAVTSVSVTNCGRQANLPLSPSGTLVSGPIVSFDGPGTTFPTVAVPFATAPFKVRFSNGSEQLLPAGKHQLTRGDIIFITDRTGNPVSTGG